MKRWLVLLILVHLPLPSASLPEQTTQVGQLLFEQLDVQKLPNNAITRLAQDNNKAFHTLRHSTSGKKNHGLLNYPDIFSIMQVKEQTWIGTYEGLNAFDTKTGKSVRILNDPNRTDSLSHNHVNTLLLDSKKRLWAATSKDISLMTHWDGKQARFDSVNKLTKQSPSWRENWLEDNLGRIWSIVDSVSLLMIEPNNWQATAFARPQGVDIGNTWTGALGKSLDGHLFYGGTKGCLRNKLT
jgi:ligand-binding sensor domain-containing protein